VASELTDAYHTDIFAFRDGQLTDVLMPKMYRTHSPRRGILLIDGPVCVEGDIVTPKPQGFYLNEAGCVVSHGLAYDSSICMDHTGTLDPALMESIRRLNEAIAQREPWIRGGIPQSYAALVFPERTRALVGKRADGPQRDCVMGWMELLVENHVLFDMMAEFRLAESDLSRYGLLILPDTVSMAAAEVEAVRKFVARGGTLVATGETSLADEKGRRAGQYQLADVLGVKWSHGFDGDCGYLVLKSPGVVEPDSAFTQWIPFLDEGQALVQATTSQALGVVGMRPSRPENLQLTPVRWPSDAPALTCNRFGKGHACYFAGRIGGVYARYQYPGIRRLVARLLAPHTTSGMRLLAEAPGCIYIEVTRQERPSRYVVHLMNAQSQVHRHWRNVKGNGPTQSPPMIVDETLPVHDVRLGLKPQGRERIRKVYQAPGETSLPMTLESDRVWTTVPCVRDYDLIVFDIE
jgi:hypothetical protein